MFPTPLAVLVTTPPTTAASKPYVFVLVDAPYAGVKRISASVVRVTSVPVMACVLVPMVTLLTGDGGGVPPPGEGCTAPPMTWSTVFTCVEAGRLESQSTNCVKVLMSMAFVAQPVQTWWMRSGTQPPRSDSAWVT